MYRRRTSPPPVPHLPPSPQLLIGRLASPSVGVRVEALRELRRHGEAARVAVPQLVAALDDDTVWRLATTPDFDGQWRELFATPSEAAVLALAAIAPGAAVERVAAAVARLHGHTTQISHGNAEPPLAERRRWSAESLAPFGPDLIAALRALTTAPDDALRAGAAAVLAALSR